MSWSKEDISFKKLSSKRVTWTTNKVFEEIGARSLDIHNTDIKSDLIPDVPPGFGVTGLLQYYDYSAGTGLTLVKDLTVSDELTYFATIFNGAGNEAFANQLVGAGATGRLFNWVSDKYDQLGLSPSLGYEIKLYDKDGNQITKTDPSDWYFDYQTGILIFTTNYQSAAVTKAKAPYYVTGYRYVGGFGITAGTGGTGSGSVGTGVTDGIAYYTSANDITSSSSFTWNSGSSLLTLNNSSFSLTGSTITAGDWAGNAITTLYGGTGLTSYTKGDILVGLGGTLIVLPVGSNNYFLAADSSTDTGLNWVSGLATTGIVSINNLDSIAQTLEVGQTGVKFNISSTGTSHTFNIPNAGVGVSGLITGTTQSIGGVKSFYDNLLIRDGKELRIYSNSNLYYSGLKSAATASTTFTLPNGTGTSGQVLATDGRGILTWVDKGVSIGETPPASPYVGDLWYDSTDGTLFIYYFDGVETYWVETFAGTGGDPVPGSGTGITSINGLLGIDQTLDVGFAGNTFNIVSAGSSHTFNLPYASEFVSGMASTVTQNFKGLKSFFDGVNLYNQSELKLYNSDNSEYTGFKSIATDSVLYSLPADDGQGLQVLYTDGAAGLGWTYVGDVIIDVVPPASPRYGTLWWDSEEANLYIYYFDGTNPQWVEASSGNGFGSGNTSAGGGITSLNTLTDFIQTFEVGSSGNEFNISSVGSSHTFNIPIAGGSGVTGLLNANAQEIWGAKSFKDDLSILDGSQLYFYEGLGTSYISFQAGTGLTSNLTFTLPDTYGLSSQVLSSDGSGNLSWISQTGNASVAVTNVAPSAPSVGDLWWHSEEGQLKVYYTDQGAGTVSSQWVDASQRWGIGGSNTGAGGTGITSINGLDAFVQTFSVGTSGNDFNISSVGSSHTFNMPLAGNGVTGLINSDTQTIYGAKTFDSDLYAINNIYVSKDNYIGGVPADFAVGGSTGVVYFGIAKGQNINRFAGMMVEETVSPLGGGILNGEVVFYTDSETVDYSTERLRITGFGTVISTGPVVVSNTSGSGSTISGSLVVSGGAGIAGTLNAVSLGVRDLTALFAANLTTSSIASSQVLHSLPYSEFKTAKYVLQCISGSDLQAQELLLIHDGSNVYMTEYSQVLGPSNTPITTYDARISGSSLELLVSPVNAVTTYVASCTAIRG
jgi:hypothetical protein